MKILILFAALDIVLFVLVTVLARQRAIRRGGLDRGTGEELHGLVSRPSNVDRICNSLRA